MKTRIITAIIILVRYSNLPCPNGCFLSGFFPAILVPTIVTVLDKTSLKLLIASVIIEIELAIIPIIDLAITKRTLAKMPMILV